MCSDIKFCSHVSPASNHVFACCYKIKSCFRILLQNRIMFSILLQNRIMFSYSEADRAIRSSQKCRKQCVFVTLVPHLASAMNHVFAFCFGIATCFRILLRNQIMFSYCASEWNHVLVYRTGIESGFRALLAESAFRILHRNRIRFSSLGANRAIGMLRSCGMLHFSTPESISPLVAACLAQTTARVSESRSVRLELGNNGQDRQMSLEHALKDLMQSDPASPIVHVVLNLWFSCNPICSNPF